jgi:hypothetical protein
MPVIQVIVILAVIGVLMWLINTQLGGYIAQPWLKLINVVAIIFTVLWLLSLFLGGFGPANVWNWRIGPR